MFRIAATTIIGSFFCLSLAAGEPQLPNVFKRGNDDKDKKASDKDDKRKKESPREHYEKVRLFAEGLYREDEAFRNTVNAQFAEQLRRHGEQAFALNTSPHSEIKVVLEDRFRYFTGLYDNAMIQDLVNQLGQKVAPREPRSKKYAFKLRADPAPAAEALSTGTIIVSTGLVAMLDNTAQLSYVLAHEAGHVARDHWKKRILMQEGEKEYLEAQKAESERKARTIGILAGAGGILTGGLLGGGNGALAGGVLGGLVGYGLTSALTATKSSVVDWSTVEEDEADEVALQAMLDAKMDVHQVPVLYAALDKAAMKDDRVGMGFWGSRSRMEERLSKVKAFLAANQSKAEAGLSTDPKQFRRLFAELKRDNGILAFYNDMLEVAHSNLSEAVDVREADPVAQYYYGKVLKLVGHTPEDRQKANAAFIKAGKTDFANQAYGAYLHQAIALIDSGSEAEKRQAVELLDRYVSCYSAAMATMSGAGSLPPHMDTIADFAARAGDTHWRHREMTCTEKKLAPMRAETVPAHTSPSGLPMPAAPASNPAASTKAATAGPPVKAASASSPDAAAAKIVKAAVIQATKAVTKK